MHEDKLTRAYVTETKESLYAVDIEVSGYVIKGDESAAVGGSDLGPSPYDLLLASLGECTAMTIRWFAIQKNWPLDKVEVELTHNKINDHEGPGKKDVFTKKITLYGDDLSEEQRSKLVDIASKCPIQRTLEGIPQIETVS